MKMPFGKHKGKEIHEVPLHYLKWAEENCDLESDLREAINFEINRQQSNTSSQGQLVKWKDDPK